MKKVVDFASYQVREIACWTWAVCEESGIKIEISINKMSTFFTELAPPILVISLEGQFFECTVLVNTVDQ